MKTLITIIALLLIPCFATAGTVTLAWDAATGATGYKVYVDGKVDTAAIFSGTTATTKVTNGEHSFYVTAFNAWGESAPSNVVKTPPIVTSPGQVTVVIVSGGN